MVTSKRYLYFFRFCLEVNNMWPCVGAVRIGNGRVKSFFFFGQQGNNIKLGNNKSVTT